MSLILTVSGFAGLLIALAGFWSSSWRRRLGSLSFPLLVLSGTFSTAQEALRTALIGDRSAQARQLSAGDNTGRLKAGPLQFNVGLSYQGEFTDNITVSEEQSQSDFIHRPQLNVSGFLPVTRTGRLSLGFGIGYAKYTSRPEFDSLFLRPDSELAYDFSVKDFFFTIYDRFNYSQEVESQGALSGVAQFPRFENTIGTRVTWVPSRWTYQAGYAHANFITLSGSGSGSSSGSGSGSGERDFSHLDRSAEQFFARMAYGFAAATQVGLETSVTLTDYDDAARADNTSYTAGPYAEWRVTEALSLSIHGGFTYFTFDSVRAPGRPRALPGSSRASRSPLQSPSYSLATYYANFYVNHRLTDFISHGLAFVHQVHPGINEGRDYFESTAVNYNAHWSLARNTSLGMTFLYEQGTESQGDSRRSTTEKSQRLGAGINVSQRLSDHLSASVSYNHLRRISDEAGRKYSQNRATVSLGYQF